MLSYKSMLLDWDREDSAQNFCLDAMSLGIPANFHKAAP